MKLCRYGAPGREKPGLLDEDGAIRDLSGRLDDIDATALSKTRMDELAALDPARLPRVEGTPRLGVPVANVGKVVAIGLNYSDHAAEAGMAIPREPVVFLKATTCLSGPHDDIVRPRNAAKIDWEVELGIVIGSRAKDVEIGAALDAVAGYCVVNDVSERAFQLERGGQWDKGKSFDGFGPVGPYLVTGDEIDDLGGLGLWLDVNGERMQEGSTRDMIFDPATIVSYVSGCMTLMPGDIICTGTPAGVGLGRTPQRFLADGDVMTLGIDGLGTQRQRIVSREGARP